MHAESRAPREYCAPRVSRSLFTAAAHCERHSRQLNKAQLPRSVQSLLLERAVVAEDAREDDAAARAGFDDDEHPEAARNFGPAVGLHSLSERGVCASP